MCFIAGHEKCIFQRATLLLILLKALSASISKIPSLSSSSKKDLMEWIADSTPWMPSTKLEGTNCFLHVFACYLHDSLSYNPSNNLAYPNWPEARTFIYCNLPISPTWLLGQLDQHIPWLTQLTALQRVAEESLNPVTIVCHTGTPLGA